MYRLTGNRMYRNWNWQVVEALQQYARVDGGGYKGLRNAFAAGDDPDNYDDLQPSFFLAETLQYLFLTFADPAALPLDQWVFNTEAHPLRVQSDGNRCRFSNGGPSAR